MKIVCLNISGNVGKTVISKKVLKPRLAAATIVDLDPAPAYDYLRERNAGKGVDYFVIPTTSDPKVHADSLMTAKSLRSHGVDTNKIRVVFNRVRPGDDLRTMVSDFTRAGFKINPNAKLELDALDDHKHLDAVFAALDIR